MGKGNGKESYKMTDFYIKIYSRLKKCALVWAFVLSKCCMMIRVVVVYLPFYFLVIIFLKVDENLRRSVLSMLSLLLSA